MECVSNARSKSAKCDLFNEGNNITGSQGLVEIFPPAAPILTDPAGVDYLQFLAGHDAGVRHGEVPGHHVRPLVNKATFTRVSEFVGPVGAVSGFHSAFTQLPVCTL